MSRLREEFIMQCVSNTSEKRSTCFCHSAVRCTCAIALALILISARAKADVVTDWNQIMLDSILASNTSPLVTSRVTAIVHASIFDAVNGIERRYIPIHVDLAAPRGASRSAAAVQAAYATLV